MSGVRYHERVFVAGPSESGKTELLNLFFSEIQCQRLLFDSKGHEFQIPEVEPVFDPADIDWREPIIHYVTTTTDVAEVDEVFLQAEKQGDLWVCVHELGDLCEFHTNKTPGSVNRYLAQGAAKGRGFGGASQEPVDMPKRAKKEINHAYAMAPAMSLEHLQEIAGIVHGTTAKEMQEAIEELHREHGPHSFIYYPRGAMREPEAFPPIPEWMRARIIVQRREAHPSERTG